MAFFPTTEEWMEEHGSLSRGRDRLKVGNGPRGRGSRGMQGKGIQVRADAVN